MLIYILNFALILFYWFISAGVETRGYNVKKLNRIFIVLICAQLIIIMGLREKHVGIDTIAYYSRFERYRLMTFSEIWNDDFQEFGFSLLIKIVGIFTDNYQCFLFVASAFCIIPIMIVIEKCSAKPFLSIVLFIALDYYASTFNLMRQSIAYALCVFSYLFIREKKFLKFFISVWLASLFHKSAYFFFPAYFVAQLNIDRKTIVAMIFIFFSVAVFKERMYNFVQSNLYSSDTYSITQTNPFGIIILILGVSIVSVMFKDNALLKDAKLNCGIMILCTGSMLLPFITIGTRAKSMVEYYCVFSILVLPGIINGIEDKNLYKIANVVALMSSMLLFLWFLSSDVREIVPYIFFWE